MSSIETAASYAISPDPVGPGQIKALPLQSRTTTEPPKPYTRIEAVVLETLREAECKGQHVGMNALLVRMGRGTRGEVAAAVAGLAERGRVSVSK